MSEKEQVKIGYVVLSVADLRAMLKKATERAKAKARAAGIPASAQSYLRRQCVVIENVGIASVDGQLQISSWDIANVENMK